MKNLFGTFITIAIIGFVIVALLWYFVISTANEVWENESGALKELVGEEVILKGDTLLVTDYSTFNQTLTLDDGRVVSAELVKKVK